MGFFFDHYPDFYYNDCVEISPFVEMTRLRSLESLCFFKLTAPSCRGNETSLQ